MELVLPEETEQFGREIARWSSKRSERLGEFDGFDASDWRTLVAFGVPGLGAVGGTAIDLVVALMEAATAALPGPVVEAQLALDAGGPDAAAVARALADGKVVTSAPPGAGHVVVGWGAVADLVVDQRSGTVVASGGLPPVRTEHLLPHGWFERLGADAGDDDRLAPQRWLLSSAAVAGLGRGCLSRTVAHAVERHQFSRPLASFQAVQFRLAECLNLLEGLRLCVLDAAWRVSRARADADVACALTWLWAERTAESVTAHCHQVYGALGFCNEAGLVQLTSQLAWYRASAGSRAAIRLVTERRTRAGGVPPSRVLAGFS